MSRDQRDKPKAPPKGANALLGDLESIRTLLAEEQASAQSKAPVSKDTGGASPASEAAAKEAAPEDEPMPADTDDDVPILDDVVEGALDVDELRLNHLPELDADNASPGLDDELFRVLLGEEWRDAAAGILDQARSAIETHKQQWLPEDTDALNAALRVRIDETLHRWLRQAVLDGIHDLRSRLLQSITDELEVSIRQQFEPDRADEDPHGE